MNLEESRYGLPMVVLLVLAIGLEMAYWWYGRDAGVVCQGITAFGPMPLIAAYWVLHHKAKKEGCFQKNSSS
jgi:hypothetical protein